VNHGSRVAQTPKKENSFNCNFLAFSEYRLTKIFPAEIFNCSH
jgi:hypothetical protein